MSKEPLTKPAALTRATAKYIAPIEEAELACRMFEAAGRLRRRLGVTAAQALEALGEEDCASWRRAARAAMDYWRECIAKANTSQ